MLNKFFSLSLQQHFFKKFRIFNNIKISFILFNNNQVLVFKNNNFQSFFCIFSKNCNIIYQNAYLYFILRDSSPLNIGTLYFFLSRLNAELKYLYRISATTFLIRGVGLKINLIENNPVTLSLKFGYSHLISLVVPKLLTVALFKKKIIFSGFNRVLLGNFSRLFYNFRPINVFTGKGLLKKQKKRFRLKEYVKKI